MSAATTYVVLGIAQTLLFAYLLIGQVWDITRVEEGESVSFPVVRVKIPRISHKNSHYAFFGSCNGMLNFLQSFLRFSALSLNTSVQFLRRMLSVAFFDESVESFSAIGPSLQKIWKISKIHQWNSSLHIYKIINLIWYKFSIAIKV